MAEGRVGVSLRDWGRESWGGQAIRAGGVVVDIGAGAGRAAAALRTVIRVHHEFQIAILRDQSPLQKTLSESSLSSPESLSTSGPQGARSLDENKDVGVDE